MQEHRELGECRDKAERKVAARSGRMQWHAEHLGKPLEDFNQLCGLVLYFTELILPAVWRMDCRRQK